MRNFDRPEHWPEVSQQILAKGAVTDYRESVVQTPGGGTMVRQWLRNPGAVAIMAMDDEKRIAVVNQYRHPVRLRLVEPPAGLLDVAGEDPLTAAKRELAEEAGLAAADWKILADMLSSPGSSTECLRIFLARGLHQTERPAGFVLADEEADMGLSWVPITELLAGVHAGVVQNIGMVTGTLALSLAIEQGAVEDLRAADSPWLAHDEH